MTIELYPAEYASKRAEEIERIEKEIRQQKKNKMLFQALPFHKRRRSASYDERRLPRACRRGVKHQQTARNQTIKDTQHTLKAHTWYAKRFSMRRSLGTYLPFKRAQKSDKFIKSCLATRGVLSDISYTGVYRVAERAAADAVTVRYGPEMERVIVCRGASETLLVSEDARYLEQEFSVSAAEQVAGVSVFQIFGEQQLFAKSEYANCSSVSQLGQPGAAVPYIAARVSEQVVLVILARERTMEVLQKAVVAGIVPCSVLELFRIGTEWGKLVYPFDLIATARGKELARLIRSEQQSELARKPKGKRPVFFPPLLLPGASPEAEGEVVPERVPGSVPGGRGPEGEAGTEGGLALEPWLFTARKGVFPLCSPVVVSDQRDDFAMSGNEPIIGEVYRSSFSFTKGRTAGVMYIQKGTVVPPGQALFVRNPKTKLFRKIEAAPADPSRIL